MAQTRMRKPPLLIQGRRGAGRGGQLLVKTTESFNRGIPSMPTRAKSERPTPIGRELKRPKGISPFSPRIATVCRPPSQVFDLGLGFWFLGFPRVRIPPMLNGARERDARLGLSTLLRPQRVLFASRRDS